MSRIRHALMLTGGLACLSLACLGPPASAQWAPLPPPRYEAAPPPPPPGPRMAWQRGSWDWDGRGYAWRPGHYVGWHPGYHAWVAGHWSRRGFHRAWIPAHWR